LGRTPTGGLALYAQRIGNVLAHPGTWAKLIRERGWGRPRLRVHPLKPKVGCRAIAPNEAWHIDVTIIKQLDGTKAYVHAVIDNYSRKILAWTVAEKLNINHLDSTATLQKLIEFYVAEHNQTMPHSAFDGQTPDEMYLGRGEAVPDELARRRREARVTRVEQNRNVACSSCPRRGAANQEDLAA
jgi:hypothetical protein